MGPSLLSPIPGHQLLIHAKSVYLGAYDGWATVTELATLRAYNSQNRAMHKIERNPVALGPPTFRGEEAVNKQAHRVSKHEESPTLRKVGERQGGHRRLPAYLTVECRVLWKSFPKRLSLILLELLPQGVAKIFKFLKILVSKELGWALQY